MARLTSLTYSLVNFTDKPVTVDSIAVPWDADANYIYGENVADENKVPTDMTVAKDASCTTIASGGSCTFSVSIPSEGKDYIVPEWCNW